MAQAIFEGKAGRGGRPKVRDAFHFQDHANIERERELMYIGLRLTICIMAGELGLNKESVRSKLVKIWAWKRRVPKYFQSP